jgi:hypothetical protein
MALVYGVIFASAIWSALILAATFIFVVVLNFTLLTEKANLISGVAHTWRLAGENFGQAMGLQFILLMMSVAFLLILSAPLLYINTSILRWNFSETDEWGASVVNFIEIFARLFAFNLVIPMVTGSAAYLYFSLIETVDAPHLKRAISLLETKYNRVST